MFNTNKTLLKCQMLRTNWLGNPGDIVYIGQTAAEKYEKKQVLKILDPRTITNKGPKQ